MCDNSSDLFQQVLAEFGLSDYSSRKDADTAKSQAASEASGTSKLGKEGATQAASEESCKQLPVDAVVRPAGQQSVTSTHEIAAQPLAQVTKDVLQPAVTAQQQQRPKLLKIKVVSAASFRQPTKLSVLPMGGLLRAGPAPEQANRLVHPVTLVPVTIVQPAPVEPEISSCDESDEASMSPTDVKAVALEAQSCCELAGR